MPPLPDDVGGYKVIQALGKGGMGAVYLAQDPAIGRLVAIKLLREGLDNLELRERFAREARSAGRLRHPNIVTLFHVGEHESQPFIVMEYIPGDTLADIVKQRLPLTVRRKLRIIEDLCRGLAHAHKSGVVHRDIKPANVLVDSEGIVKILDFGIARIGEQEMTRLGMMMGTPNYMSPEQINPGTADHRSDVYAVGLVFYELLTYRRAFPGDSFSVLHSIVNSEPEPIEALVPDLDPEIAAILRRTLQKNPENRYQDIGAMRAELARVRGRLRATSASDDGSDEGPITQSADSALSADTPTIVAPPITEVEHHLTLAREALEARQFERALAECNLALALDANNAVASELRHQARHELDLAACSDLLIAARSALAEGRISTAIESLGKVEGLTITGDTAAALLDQVNALRQEIEGVRQKANRIRAAVEQGRSHLKAGNLEAAQRSADEARDAAPDDGEVMALQAELAGAVADRDRKRAEEAQRQEQAAQERRKREQAALEQQEREEAARQAKLDEERKRSKLAEEAERARRDEEKKQKILEEEREQARLDEERIQARLAEEMRLARLEEETTRARLEEETRRAKLDEERKRAALAEQTRQARVDQEAREQRRARLEQDAERARAAALSSDETVVLKRPPTPASTPVPEPALSSNPLAAPATLAAATTARADARSEPPPVRETRSTGTPGVNARSWAIPAAAAAVIVIAAIAWMVRAGGDKNMAGSVTPTSATPPAAQSSGPTSSTVPPASAAATAPPAAAPPATTPPAAAPPATDPPATAPAGNPQVASLHREVTALLGRGDTGRATRLISGVPSHVQSDPLIQRDIDQVVSASRTAASREQQRVARPQTSSNEYLQGIRQQSLGQRLGQQGRKIDAAMAFLEAAQLFTRAASASQVAEVATTSVPPATVAAPPPSAATVAASPPPAATVAPAPPPEPTTTSIAPTATPSPPTATQAAPAGPTPAQDTAAIQNVLRQFADGYRALDPEAIRKAFPAVNANFRDVRAYELELLDVQVELQGDRATVTCRRSVRQTGRSGRPIESVIPTVFSLRRAPSGWIIEGVK